MGEKMKGSILMVNKLTINNLQQKRIKTTPGKSGIKLIINVLQWFKITQKTPIFDFFRNFSQLKTPNLLNMNFIPPVLKVVLILVLIRFKY